MNKDFVLLLFVTLMSVGANLPSDYVALSGIDRKYLLAGLLIVVTIALVRYSKFALVLAVIILAVGANLPQDIAQSLNIDPRILIAALGAIIVLSFANRIIKLPTGLDKNRDLDDEYGTRALFSAIANRRIRIVRTIIDAGTNIEARTAQGFTPLMIAAAKGYDEIVRLLLSKGADATAVDAQGRNALHIAKQAGRKGSVIMLRDAIKLSLQGGAKIPGATQFWWQASRKKARAST